MTAGSKGLQARSSRQSPLLLLLTIAAVLAAGVLWLREQSAPANHPEELPRELRDEPDLFINDAIIHQFHPDGRRKYLLQAKSVNHFDDRSLTRLQQPDLLLEGRAEPWQATSDYGSVTKRPNPNGVLEEVVFLREDVDLSQRQEPPRYLSIRTASLYLYPDREYVETDESVTIDTHTGRTMASSMSGNLATGVLRLTGATKQVQTIVLPFQFK